MEVYSIGTLLKEYRERLKISQEDLAFDLCAVSTLSRIESGAQVPGRKLVEALFSRMGMLMPAGNLPMSRADYVRSNLEYAISDKVANANCEIYDLLEKYRKCSDKLDVLEEQFYLTYKTIADDSHEHNSEQSMKNFENALRLSMHDYEIGKIPNVRYLTKIELLLLNNIARRQYFLGQKNEAIQLMEFLRSYYENGIVSEVEKAKSYPVVLFNLGNWYGLMEDAENAQRAVDVSELGIHVCVMYGKLYYFPYLFFNKGYNLAQLGKKDEGEKYIAQAFTVFEMMNKHEEVVYATKIINEKFGYHFPQD